MPSLRQLTSLESAMTYPSHNVTTQENNISESPKSPSPIMTPTSSTASSSPRQTDGSWTIRAIFGSHNMDPEIPKSPSSGPEYEESLVKIKPTLQLEEILSVPKEEPTEDQQGGSTEYQQGGSTKYLDNEVLQDLFRSQVEEIFNDARPYGELNDALYLDFDLTPRYTQAFYSRFWKEPWAY